MNCVLLYHTHISLIKQCGGSGSTPQQAADFINSNLDESSTTDFVGVCEWEVSGDTVSIGNTEVYGSIGSACGYAQTSMGRWIV